MHLDQAGAKAIEMRRSPLDVERPAVTSRRRALDRLWTAFRGDLCGPVLITGEPGAGKSWLVRRFADGLPAGWGVADVEITSALDGLEMLRLLGDDLGLEMPDRLGAARLRVEAGLRDAAADGRGWLLIVDEVQRDGRDLGGDPGAVQPARPAGRIRRDDPAGSHRAGPRAGDASTAGMGAPPGTAHPPPSARPGRGAARCCDWKAGSRSRSWRRSTATRWAIPGRSSGSPRRGGGPPGPQSPSRPIPDAGRRRPDARAPSRTARPGRVRRPRRTPSRPGTAARLSRTTPPRGGIPH